MGKEKIRIVVYSLLMLLFIGVPAYMICCYNNVVEKGTLYRFRCEPIDPIDAFRGRYVYLRFSQTDIKSPKADSLFKRGDEAYAFIKKDSAGYAYVDLVYPEPGPDTFNNWFATTVEWVSYDSIVNINFPFDHFYMNEETAPLAEKAYTSEVKVDSVYADVRIYHGKAVIQELYMDGLPVKEYLKRHYTKYN